MKQVLTVFYIFSVSVVALCMPIKSQVYAAIDSGERLPPHKILISNTKSCAETMQDHIEVNAVARIQKFKQEQRKLKSQDSEEEVNPVDPKTEFELTQAMKATMAEFERVKDLKLALLILKQKYQWSELLVEKTFARLRSDFADGFARSIYRPTLLSARKFGKFFGTVWRAYVIRSAMSVKWVRWSFVERLFEEGKDQQSHAADQEVGMVTTLTKIVSPTKEQLQEYRNSLRQVGKSLVLRNGENVNIKPYVLSPMINLSGMSYPQLSVNAILSLLYIHVSLAKKGIRYTYNSGEGGTLLHLALLDKSTDRKKLASAVARYAIENGIKIISKSDQAKIEVAIEQIFEARDELFKGFSQADLELAQIVGQLGPALNGARTLDDHLDLERLMEYGANPSYAGTQIKLKQAAKKGAKVDASKMGALAAFLRKLKQGQTAEAPDLSIEWDTLEGLAESILVIKMITGKPVELKFAVGDADEVYDMLAYLKEAGALPDKLQIDGSGYIRAPGSGNVPMSGNTSHNITTAVLLMDVILKKLGIRDEIYLEATGDIITPEEALMNQSLGADGVAAARLWLGMGLGCALVMKCATGACYYGIASNDEGLFSRGLDPMVVGPKGARAAEWWYLAYTNSAMQSGASGTGIPYRVQNSYGDPKNTIRIRGEYTLKKLDQVFPSKMIAEELKSRIDSSEVERLLFQDDKPNGQNERHGMVPKSGKESHTLIPSESESLMLIVNEALNPM